MSTQPIAAPTGSGALLLAAAQATAGNPNEPKIQKKWRRIRERAAELAFTHYADDDLGGKIPQFDYGRCIYITAIQREDDVDVKPGTVFMAVPNNAAQRIIEGSHRLATKEEIEAYRREMEKRTLECRRLTEEARNTTIVRPSPESNDQIAAAVTAGVRAAMEQAGKSGRKQETT